MVALFLAAVIAAQPAPATAVARVSVTILAGTEVHFDRADDRREHKLERKTVRGEDGKNRPALLVEFE